MAVPIAPGARLEAGAPVQLFHVEEATENYDVAPDESRFLVSTPSEKVRESPIRVIVNRPSTLKGEKTSRPALASALTTSFPRSARAR